MRRDEVRRHVEDTHLLWLGSAAADGVYCYRVHSPVILVEFDHQRGIAFDNDEPSRNHIQSVVRTPNGATTAATGCGSTTSATTARSSASGATSLGAGALNNLVLS